MSRWREEQLWFHRLSGVFLCVYCRVYIRLFKIMHLFKATVLLRLKNAQIREGNVKKKTTLPSSTHFPVGLYYDLSFPFPLSVCVLLFMPVCLCVCESTECVDKQALCSIVHSVSSAGCEGPLARQSNALVVRLHFRSSNNVFLLCCGYNGPAF